MNYDPSNIFAKILAGEIPAHKVYEDETTLVMMDIFPQSRGHILVIPKAASRNLLDADSATLAALLPLVQRFALLSNPRPMPMASAWRSSMKPQPVKRYSTCISTLSPPTRARKLPPMVVAKRMMPSWRH